MTRWQPNTWGNFYLVLGGMHLLMSFVGCIGNLMENTRLSNILKAAFGGVDKMLMGKNCPNNIRALRMAVEEILRPVLLDCVLSPFDDLMSYLEGLASKSRLAKLWLHGLVWPIFIALRFIRSSFEAKWPLQIHTVRLMLPYFAAADHWHYLRYATVYLIRMAKLPSDLFKKFLTREHAMRHCNGHWNSI